VRPLPPGRSTWVKSGPKSVIRTAGNGENWSYSELSRHPSVQELAQVDSTPLDAQETRNRKGTLGTEWRNTLATSRRGVLSDAIEKS
jgi:hypothetical protein